MPCFAFKAACLAVFFFIFAPIGLQGQIYRVYRPFAAPDISPVSEEAPLYGWELSLSAMSSVGNLRDGGGWTISRSMPGVRLRMLKEIFPAFSFGIEGQWLHAVDFSQQDIDKLEKYAFAGVIKWVFTPETRPQMYLLLAGGMVFDRVEMPDLDFGNFNQRSSVWSAGLGIQAPLGRRILLTGEYRLSYETAVWNNLLLQASSDVRHEFAVGLSLLF